MNRVWREVTEEGGEGGSPGAELWLKDLRWQEQWAGCGQDSQRQSSSPWPQGQLTGGLGPTPGRLESGRVMGSSRGTFGPCGSGWFLWLPHSGREGRLDPGEACASLAEVTLWQGLPFSPVGRGGAENPAARLDGQQCTSTPVLVPNLSHQLHL